MSIKFLLILFANCFTFAEMKPFMSISQDLSIINRCNSSSPVDKRVLNLALVEKNFEKGIDENFKCFLYCLYHNYRWMDSNGIFQYSEMKNTLAESSLDEPSIEYLLSTCTETEIEDKCGKAFSFTECFWIESEKLEQVLRSEDDDFC